MRPAWWTAGHINICSKVVPRPRPALAAGAAAVRVLLAATHHAVLSCMGGGGFLRGQESWTNSPLLNVQDDRKMLMHVIGALVLNSAGS